MIRLLISLFYTFNSFVANVGDLQTTVVFLPTETDDNLSTILGRKNALRYGFHQISDCKSFEKSFLCIQKCVDLNYDVAHADKSCKCTCYTKKDREKYKHVPSATRTRWRSGAPKTSIPPWAIDKEKLSVTGDLESSSEGNVDGINAKVLNKVDNTTETAVTDINSNVTSFTANDNDTTQINLSTNAGSDITETTSATQDVASTVTSDVTT